jgi:CheY-like chemotaxis protein
LRILVAEDNTINQSLFRALLEPEGHEVRIARDGAEALAAIQREPFDLVLMDIHMPVMDGPTTAARIRLLEGPAARVPIIAVTGDAVAGDRERFLNAAMNGYVSKPIDSCELYAEIAALVPKLKKAEPEAPAFGTDAGNEPQAERLGADDRERGAAQADRRRQRKSAHGG